MGYPIFRTCRQVLIAPNGIHKAIVAQVVRTSVVLRFSAPFVTAMIFAIERNKKIAVQIIGATAKESNPTSLYHRCKKQDVRN